MTAELATAPAPPHRKGLAVLDARYLLIEEIGSGGMGVVHRARQLSFEREVAVKVLRAQLGDSADARRRFEKEAYMIARLRHPATLKLYDFGRTERGEPYLVTELLVGRSLAERISAGPMPWREVLDVLATVAGALEEAHGFGIIHRDLKPKNIFLEEIGGETYVRLLDFGVAKARDEATETDPGKLLGTPAYLSPEQARGERASERSDLYSLGAIAYECLTGEKVFDAETPVALLLKHIQDAPATMRTARAPDGVPAAVEALVMRLLAKRREDRVESARALRAEIQLILSEGRDDSTVLLPSVAKPRGSRTAHVALGAVLAALLFAVVFASRSLLWDAPARGRSPEFTAPAASAQAPAAVTPQVTTQVLDAAPPSAHARSAESGPTLGAEPNPAPAVPEPKMTQTQPTTRTPRSRLRMSTPRAETKSTLAEERPPIPAGFVDF